MDLSRFREVFSASLQITEVVPFGATPKDIRAGRAEMPAEGARSNHVASGTVTGEINGTWELTDYYTLLPSGNGRSHAHGIITADDGKRISVHNRGSILVEPGAKFGIVRHTMELHATDPALNWVNREPYFLTGTVDLQTYEIRITAYAAMQEMATEG